MEQLENNYPTYSTDTTYLLEEQNFSYFTQKDGWLAGILLFSLFFGPRTPPFRILPPIRFVDFVIVFMAITRWIRSYSLYGGFLFSYRTRPVNILLVSFSFVVLFSSLVNSAVGTIPFHIKNLFYPIQFLRMALIVAIMASLHFEEKQTKQFLFMLFVICLLSSGLAFLQLSRPWLVSGFLEKYYSSQWKLLDIPTKGYAARVTGTFGNPNRFSISLAQLGIASLAMAINIPRKKDKLLALVSYCLVAAAILFATASRTGVVGLAATTFLLLVLGTTGKGRLWVILLGIMVGGFYIFIRTHASDLYINPRLQILLGSEKLTIIDALRTRFVYWIEGIKGAKESPLIGLGATKIKVQLTDNGYIQLLLRTGIIGLFIIMLVYIRTLINGLKAFFIESDSAKRGIIAMGVSIVIGQMLFEITGDFLWNPENQALFAAFLGLLAGTYNESFCEIRQKRLLGVVN